MRKSSSMPCVPTVTYCAEGQHFSAFHSYTVVKHSSPWISAISKCMPVHFLMYVYTSHTPPYIHMRRIQSSRSTSSERFIFAVIVENIRRFWRRSGRGNSIFRSRRPGRNRAGSRVSARFVAIITYNTGIQANMEVLISSMLKGSTCVELLVTLV